MTRYELVNHLLESDSELSFQDPRCSLTSSDALVARCTHRQRIALFVAVSGFIVVLTIMAIVIFTGLRATPSYSNPTDPGMARLPGDISPIHYDLSLETDMDRFTYNGTVNIRIKVCIARHLLIPDLLFAGTQTNKSSDPSREGIEYFGNYFAHRSFNCPRCCYQVPRLLPLSFQQQLMFFHHKILP